MTPALAALARLSELPGVTAAVDEARRACTELRWHQALRRRIPEAAAESRVRGATASALLEGAEPAGSEGSLDLVRDLLRGALAWDSRPHDPQWQVLAGVVRATAATEGVGAAQLRAPAQLLAGLHTAAAAGLVPASELGRPRGQGETAPGVELLGPAPEVAEVRERLRLVEELVAAVPDGRASVPVLAAVVHAEVAVARPFTVANAVVARALERALLRVGGVDPTGVAVPEVGHADRGGTDYRGALAAYAEGSPEGVRLWVLHCAEAVRRAAAEGTRIADAVLVGRLR